MKISLTASYGQDIEAQALLQIFSADIQVCPLQTIKKFYEVLLNYIDSVKEEDTLYDTYFEDNEKMTSPQETGNLFTVNLIFPENYISEVAFIGLFRGPFPDKNPVLGKAVIPYKTGNKCIFNNIPDGKYYLMACSVEKGSGYLNFFDLRDSLRSRLKNPLIFPSDEKIESSLLFRKPETTDFPIILNLPNFVFRIMERRINNSLTEISQIRQ